MGIALEELNQEIIDYIEDPIESTSPFVIVDPFHKIVVEDIISIDILSIDLSKTKAGDIFHYLDEILSKKYPVVLFKNIDNISSRKNKLDWESLIINGLKSEDKTFMFESDNAIGGLKEYNIPFSKFKVICTCNIYPDYLKERGNLGWIGADIS